MNISVAGIVAMTLVGLVAIGSIILILRPIFGGSPPKSRRKRLWMSAQIGIGLAVLITAQSVFDTIWRDSISDVDLQSVLTYVLCLAIPFGIVATFGMYSRFSIWLGWVRDSSDADEK